jgi:hypothetical protein
MYLLKQAVEILRCVGGLCRPLQVFRANHFFEEFRHQTKDNVKLTSAQLSRLVSFLFFAVSENPTVHCKKRFAIFPSPAGMSLTKLSQDGNTLIIPAQGDFGQ